MITKGIIKSIDLLGNTCTVHIPFFETAGNDPIIETATVSNTPGSYNGYKVGDAVYVAFEDGRMDTPVIIGKLYLGTEKEKADPRGVINVEESTAAKKATLPADSKLTAEIDNNVPNTTVPYVSLSSIANELNTLNTNVGQMDRDYGNRFKQIISNTDGLESKIEQTAEAIKLEAKAREEAIDGVTKEYNSAIEQTAESINASVVQKASDGTESGFGWDLNSSSWSIQAKLDGEQKNILTADTTGLSVYGNITATALDVTNATIKGKLTANNIKVTKKDDPNKGQTVFEADSDSGKVIIGGFDVTPEGFGKENIQFTVDGLTIGSNFWVKTDGSTSIAKGDPGDPGKDGEIGTFHILASPDQLRVSGVKSSYAQPGTFSFNFLKQTGDEDPIDLNTLPADDGYYYTIEESDGTSTTKDYNSDNPYNYYDIDDLQDIDSITIKLYNKNNSLLGSKTISVLQDGIDGKDGISYYIVPALSQIKIDPYDSMVSINFSCYRKIGSNDPEALPGYEENKYYNYTIDIDTYKEGSWTATSNSCDFSNYYSYTLSYDPQKVKTITIKLYDNYWGNVLDTKTISIVKDGRSVLSTTKFYKLTNYEPSPPYRYDYQTPYEEDWTVELPVPSTTENEEYSYYECVLTVYDMPDEDGYYYQWSNVVKNSMLSIIQNLKNQVATQEQRITALEEIIKNS